MRKDTLLFIKGKKMENFWNFWFSWNCFAWIGIEAVSTGVLAIAMNIYNKPTGFKTGILTSAAFTLGILATFIRLF